MMDKFAVGILIAGLGAIVTMLALNAAWYEIQTQCTDWVYDNFEVNSWSDYGRYNDICISKNWIVIKPIQLPTVIHIQEPDVQ